MRIILACSSHWHTQQDAVERYEGRSALPTDLVTGAQLYYLHPDYKGQMGLKAWYARTAPLFRPVSTYIACGTWSDPSFSLLGQLATVVNAGVDPVGPYNNKWQYFGCALTALMAALCNRRDWDVLVFLEPDVLPGAIDWNSVLRQFLARPEVVAGPAWYSRQCDFILWKPAAAASYLHCRTRPNLDAADDAPWIDDELHRLFLGGCWNPWPNVESIRQDHPHLASPRVANDVVMGWPFVRLPDPAIVDRYLAECTALATPVRQA